MHKWNFPSDISFANGKEWTSVNYGNFEGALIHRSVVDSVGLPDVRFFIAGDDSIYGFLASFHTNVIYVNHIGIRRMLPASGGFEPNKLYFFYRNKFLTYDHMAAALVPVSRVTLWARILVLFGWSLLHTPEIRTRKHLLRVYQGLRDGWRGRFGRPEWLGGKR
jgi:GT2 family glycosyltransferase